LFGYFGPNVFSGPPRSGKVIRGLLVLAIILIIVKLLRAP
jgi:hypothetical protein